MFKTVASRMVSLIAAWAIGMYLAARLGGWWLEQALTSLR
jgi:hypothetical protein